MRLLRACAIWIILSGVVWSYLEYPAWGQAPANAIGAGMVTSPSVSGGFFIYPHLFYDRRVSSHLHVRVSFFMVECPECETSDSLYIFPVRLVYSFHVAGRTYVDVGAGILPSVVDRVFVLDPIPSLGASLCVRYSHWLVSVGFYLTPPILHLTVGLRF